jgi:hypothetical protein
MPIEWAQLPGIGVSGYGDLLRQVYRHGRLETYDLVLSNFDNGYDDRDAEQRDAAEQRRVDSVQRRYRNAHPQRPYNGGEPRKPRKPRARKHKFRVKIMLRDKYHKRRVKIEADDDV